MANGNRIKKETHNYYNERAQEYEEIYTLCVSPPNISALPPYWKEVKTVSKLITKYIGEKHIDIACGTGFWLPFYHHKCQIITMLDQSANMISKSREKVGKLQIQNKVELICKDILNYNFPDKFYDSILAGLLFSHLTDHEEKKLFERLRHTLKPCGNFILVDSIWTKERAKTREKSSLQKRILNNGQEFTIFKKYFTSENIINLFKKHKVELRAIHPGKVFITAIGTI